MAPHWHFTSSNCAKIMWIFQITTNYFHEKYGEQKHLRSHSYCVRKWPQKTVITDQPHSQRVSWSYFSRVDIQSIMLPFITVSYWKPLETEFSPQRQRAKPAKWLHWTPYRHNSSSHEQSSSRVTLFTRLTNLPQRPPSGRRYRSLEKQDAP